MSRIPGFTAESTLYSNAGRYYFGAGVATLSWGVEQAFYLDPGVLWSIAHLPQGVRYALCCWACYRQHPWAECIPTQDALGCYCSWIN